MLRPEKRGGSSGAARSPGASELVVANVTAIVVVVSVVWRGPYVGGRCRSTWHQSAVCVAEVKYYTRDFSQIQD